MTVLSYGSASTIQTNLAALAFAILAAFGDRLAGRPRQASPASRRWPSSSLAALLGYAFLQTVPLPDFANPAWNSAPGSLGPVAGDDLGRARHDARRADRPGAAVSAFIAALSLFQGDDEALLLWRALAYFGAGYAAFGVVQDLFFPEQILFEPKRFYVGSLTASFINRNTAGTFFGIAFLLNLGLVFFHLRKVHLRSLMRRTAELRGRMARQARAPHHAWASRRADRRRALSHPVARRGRRDASSPSIFAVVLMLTRTD